jgi:hypothetical protein
MVVSNKSPFLIGQTAAIFVKDTAMQQVGKEHSK